MKQITDYESNVRSYCRYFHSVFAKGQCATLTTAEGEEYIDFLGGAGALNYGHNNPYIKQKLIEFIESDAVMHGLDLFTPAKAEFIQKFEKEILIPRGYDYVIQFTGPTGTNAVEAALKLARKVTGRTTVWAFMGAFHGMTVGALSATGNKHKREGAGMPLGGVTFIPYPVGPMQDIDSIAYMETLLSDTHSGIEKPAAIILETVQAEGGINPAPAEWLKKLRELCTKHDIILIADDIQVGCGRTGNFFSFERADIKPDMVTLAKSISGYGLPMSIVLIRRDLDKWHPGEHNGTFRGNQLAFVGGSAAIDLWNNGMSDMVKRKGELVEQFIKDEILPLDSRLFYRGLGLIWGVDMSKIGGSELTDAIQADCYNHHLVIETAGRDDSVMKILPPLVIPEEQLLEGLRILRDSIKRNIEGK